MQIINVCQAILDRQKQTDQESRKLQIVQVKRRWMQIVEMQIVEMQIVEMDVNSGDGCK